MDKKLIITIEREYGSGGRVLGRTLPEQLGGMIVSRYVRKNLRTHVRMIKRLPLITRLTSTPL